MTPTEAQKVWDRMVAAWPNAAWPDMTRRQWLHDLLAHERLLAFCALERERRTSGDPPTFARFLAVMRAIAGPDATLPELGPHASASARKAAVRQLIADTRARHRWPTPQPPKGPSSDNETPSV